MFAQIQFVSEYILRFNSHASFDHSEKDALEIGIIEEESRKPFLNVLTPIFQCFRQHTSLWHNRNGISLNSQELNIPQKQQQHRS